MKQMPPHTFAPLQSPAKQKGISLLLTVIVLFGLTIIAITITNSNQTQSMLVRNNQLRLEAFNASFTEIDAQIDAINRLPVNDAITLPYLNQLFLSDINTTINEGDNGFELISVAAEGHGDPDPDPDPDSDPDADENVAVADVLRNVSMVSRGTCQVFGEDADADTPSILCFEFRIDSNTQLANTNVGSMQRQIYEFKTVGGSE